MDPQTSTHETASADTMQEEESVQRMDLQRILGDVVRQMDEADLKSREIGVMFEDLRVVGLGSTSSYQATFGSLFNPQVILENIQKMRHPTTRDLLLGFEGVVKPGEMLLVLGRPGAGCTTLLKTLANQREEFHSTEGTVLYDSFTPQEIRNTYRGDVLFCPEDDIHFPTLTVDETIKFAARLRAPHNRLGYSREEYVDAVTDTLLTVFGLKEVRNTLIGDAGIRGVSGGQKKRVSICETLATRPRLVSWDNSTRGLDASTALEFIQALRTFTDVARMTTIVSLYQPGESLYKHFDKVCVLYEGKMAYFGPASEARSYFINMGYEPANRQTTADFLVAVTDPNGRIPRPDMHISMLPSTAEEYAIQFRKSDHARENRAAIEAYKAEFVGKPQLKESYAVSAQDEHSKHTRKASPYLISWAMQARAVAIRRIKMLKGDWLALGLNTFFFVFEALLAGFVFLKVPGETKGYFSRGGVIYFALLFSALMTMSEIPALFGQRAVVLRHKKYALHHPFIDMAALFLVDLPITLLQLLVFSAILYSLVQLQQSAGQFFVFFLFILSSSLAMKGWFRALSAAFSEEAPAQALAGVSIMAIAIYTGYTVPKPAMIGGLKWISYLNPLRYAFESIITNEFRTVNGRCSGLVPQGPGYENVSIANQACPTVGSTPGNAFVRGASYMELSYGFSYSNTWKNFGILVAFIVGFVGASLIFTEINARTPANSGATLYKRNAKNKLPRNGKARDEEEKLGETVTIVDSGELNEKDCNMHMQVEEVRTPGSVSTIAPPVTKDIFSWQNVNYTVQMKDGSSRRLLNNVTAFVAPGKLTALMGESGAGKTTLLNVLAERVDTGAVTGDKLVNGRELPSDFQAQTGYCQQTDTHVPSATVREALLFSAKLRQPHSVPLAEKEAYVDKCLKMCGLEAFRDATVGSLNIENRKRTTIAVELAAKPKLLLFLDEPTSGLDSQSAWGIMSFLRDLANSGQAILCTIHQPSAELFQVFDRLLLLRKGGETVFFGDLGHNATSLISYFERNGSRACQPEENPAEFMLDVIGAGATAESVQDWHQIWRGSPEKEQLDKDLENIHEEGRRRPPVKATFDQEFATPWWYQTWELLKRNSTSHYRDPTYILSKLVLFIFTGIFIGFSFFKAKNSQQGNQNKLFAIFMATIICVPLADQLIVLYIRMRNIYEIREKPSRMYSWTALVTSQILTELPWNILGGILFFLCWYWTVGFPTLRAGYTFLMISIVLPFYLTSLGQVAGAMSPNAEIGGIVFSFIISFVLTFNGVMQPYKELGWWKWLYRATPFTYLIEGLVVNAVGHDRVVCSPLELATITPPAGQTCGQYMAQWLSTAGGYVVNPNDTTACQYCSTATADVLFDSAFHMKYSSRWRNVGIMAAFLFFNIAATYFFTYWCRLRTWSTIETISKKLRRLPEESQHD